MICQCQQSELNKVEYICLSPLCLQKLIPLCQTCAYADFHENHQIVQIENIFFERNKFVENQLKLETQKKEYQNKFSEFIQKIKVYSDDLTEQINAQIGVQQHLIEQMIRVEKIELYYSQLNKQTCNISSEVEKLLSLKSICPQFDITNIVQYAESLYQQFEQNINKKQEIENMQKTLNENLQKFKINSSKVHNLQQYLIKVKSIVEYEQLIQDIDQNMTNLKHVSMQYSSDSQTLKAPLLQFTEEIIPYIKQVNEQYLPQFDTLQPSKVFYDNNLFKAVMAQYFQSGDSLINLNFRVNDNKYFELPPFLSGYSFQNLKKLSLNIDSKNLKNLISFIKNHPQLQQLEILLNSDQQLLSTLYIQQLFILENLPNIQHFKIDATRLHFSNPAVINSKQEQYDLIDNFLYDKRSSLQTLQIDGLIEFNYQLDQIYKLLFKNDNQMNNHLRKLTFLIKDVDAQLDESDDKLHSLYPLITQNMPLLENIKFYKRTEFVDVDRHIKLLNKLLKQRSIIRKVLVVLKSRLKFFRKEIILTIMNEFISSISNIINNNEGINIEQ